MSAYLHAIGTAVPDHEVHSQFIAWARGQVEPRLLRLFDRMASRSGIGRRWSVLPRAPGGGTPVEAGGFYSSDPLPGTQARMQVYAQAAPALALDSIGRLAAQVDTGGITHLVVASCTGFVAPGVDQIIAGRLGLAPSTERLLVGFMGCYAAVAALRQARHIVRSDPGARVLVVTVELCTLHMQATPQIESLLGQLQFGDGAAAALVTGEAGGFSLERPFAAALPDSAGLIRWDITDGGFVMGLSGEVPGRIAAALADRALADVVRGGADEIDGWAVHAGGRSILDAVEHALELPADALAASRDVLMNNGNMSSSTLMFTLARLLAGPPVERGVALAFGPGLAAEGFGFASA